jgi:hypothetical protein
MVRDAARRGIAEMLQVPSPRPRDIRCISMRTVSALASRGVPSCVPQPGILARGLASKSLLLPLPLRWQNDFQFPWCDVGEPSLSSQKTAAEVGDISQ